MKRCWTFSRHFAERVVQRVRKNPKSFANKVAAELNNRCLEFVFECHVYGNIGRRFVVDDHVVAYAWDSDRQSLVVKTVWSIK